ncbi:MAG TPA: glycosyltransferase [Chloroflexota bacterium]|nr:glycosyltransferase [Chloroflexota bacterium]
MADQPFLSLSMIVKNEEADLDACLRSARALCDELVVVDTGSTDRTVEIARAHGARVFHFAWCDDFSAARNFALDRARGQWVLHLDADEIALEATPGALRAELRAQPTAVQFLRVPVRSRGHDTSGGDEHLARRVFRRHPDVRWHRRIHENIANHRGEPIGSDALSTGLVVDHRGYADAAVRRVQGKNDRNVRLLTREILENPTDPVPHFYLAREQAAAGEHDAAIQTCRALLERRDIELPDPFAWAVRCQAMRSAIALGDHARAVELGAPVEAACGSPELLYTLGHAHLQLNDLDAAERCFAGALASGGRPAPFQTKAGAGTWRPRLALGDVAWQRGEQERAIKLWRAAHAAAPAVGLANLALGRGLLATGRPAEAVPLLELALELEPNLGEAHLRLSQAALALGDAQAAYDRLDALVRARPDVADHWQWLGDVLLALGEHAAAVEVLGQAIERHQDRPGVYVTLGTALETLGRHEDALNAFALAAALDPTSEVARAGLAIAAHAHAADHSSAIP